MESGKSVSRRVSQRRSPLLGKLAAAANGVPAEAVKAYAPTARDAELVNAILTGATTHVDVAMELGLSIRTITSDLHDPVRAAWIAAELQRCVRDRVGIVDAAMFSKAIRGDTNAAKLVYDRFDPAIEVSEERTESIEQQVRELSDAELLQLARAEGVEPGGGTAAPQEVDDALE